MRVYVTNDLVVKYHPNWPVEPNYFSTDKSYLREKLWQDYQQALEKAIAEAVPFEDQGLITKLIRDQHFKALYLADPLGSGFYEVSGVEWHSWHWINPCTRLGDCQLTGEEYRRACYEGCKKQYRVARVVITPPSYGEKEEQKRTISSVCRAWTKRDIVQLTIKDMENFEASKPSSVDTNIEEKKITASSQYPPFEKFSMYNESERSIALPYTVGDQIKELYHKLSECPLKDYLSYWFGQSTPPVQEDQDKLWTDVLRGTKKGSMEDIIENWKSKYIIIPK